jgi:hypothetical protein
MLPPLSDMAISRAAARGHTQAIDLRRSLGRVMGGGRRGDGFFMAAGGACGQLLHHPALAEHDGHLIGRRRHTLRLPVSAAVMSRSRACSSAGQAIKGRNQAFGSAPQRRQRAPIAERDRAG